MRKIFLALACHLCSVTFNRKANLRRHLTIHNLNCLPGKQRNEPISKRDALFVDDEQEADVINYLCPSCPCYYESIKDLANHIPQHCSNVNPPLNSDANLEANIEDYIGTSISPILLTHLGDDQLDVDHDIELNLDAEISFTSDNHHPLRKYDYVFQEVTEWKTEDHKWYVGSIDVMKFLHEFRDVSISLNKTGNIRDLRILSLYCIFTFSNIDLDDGSVSKYMGQTKHDTVMNDLAPIIQKKHSSASNNLSTWSNALTSCPTSWIEVTNQCLDILNDAKQSNNLNDLIAATCILQLGTRLTKTFGNDMCEDSFVHMYLDCLLDGIFSTEPTLKQDWANRWMSTSREDSKTIFKPDWVVYVKPWHQTFDVVACEVKAPKKSSNGPVSDFVKLGIEMMRMLSVLKNLVDSPYVLGVLVEGLTVRTYYMDTLGESAWRMVELGQAELITRLTRFGMFPVLFQLIMQVKDLALEVGKRIEAAQLDLAMTKRKIDLVSPPPILSWKKSRKLS